MTLPNSPDLPPVVNLTLHDVAEQDLVDAMVAQVQTKLPTWVPTEASIEVTLIEAWAIATGQAIYTLNQIPQILFDAFLVMNGVQRVAASPAAGTVAVTMATGTTGAKTIPAGSIFRIFPDSSTAVDVIAPAPVTQNPGDGLTFTVPVVAVLPGSGPNGIAPGTLVNLQDPLSWVESSVVGTALAGGTDTETDGDFYPRAAAYLRRRSQTVVMLSDFSTSALETPGVGRALAINKWDSIGGSGHMPGDNLGHITVVVATAAGTATTSGVKTAVLNKLVAGAHAALALHVIDPVIVSVTVAVTAVAAAGYTSTDVHDRVLAALTDYLNPASAPWGWAPTAFDIVGVVAKVYGVAHVTGVSGAYVGSTPSSLMDLPSATPTLTVTVTGP